ncbi:YIL169C-like protein [Saccharomyces cerevisiae x Saccharomyces kudriavzevii VIN7]|uniref:YIL169C-like protein n=1 Tax=Saccharomyces cerevisiae x Saccharomyces kudriavzevii (strain VIN7) TaxID=1095631 RepID=H0GW32_SACCK|nr:YIL169C-like protein [Saccharomyces cerevisiae x Saccharomyces kudriavzevii VIN7]
MFNRLNKFQAALALALYSQRALGESYGNSTSSDVLSTITSSASSASATASNSLSSSDGTVYLPSTTISGDLTVTGKVIATEAVEIATGGKLTLLDGEKYVFSSDLKVHGDLIVGKSEASYEGTSFDVSGETFEVSGNFSAEESAAVSASIYSFTPGSFESSGDISLSLSKAKKGEVTFSPYANSGAFSLSNAILNGGSVSSLERRAEDEGSENNGEINLDNGSTYVIVEPVSGNGTVNIISGNLYLHYPDTFTGQTVVFKGEGVLAVDPTETNATPIPVVGYTGKNQIAITADITALSYDGTTGVLTATQGNRQFSFAIGTGFSSSGFSVSEGTFAGLYTYYLNYDGVVATSAASSSTSTATSTTTSAATSADTSAATSTISGASTSAAVSGSGSLSSSASSSGVSNSTTVSGSVGSSTLASASITSSAAAGTAFTSGTGSVYTTTLTYANATSTVVVSCSKATDARGNIYTITKTVPCSSTTATITSCDENGCHVPAPTATDATETVSSKSYTTVTVTHCDDNGCKVKTVTTEAPKQTTATTATVSEKTYTTITVTQCDDNGCNAKTITSEALKPTSLSTEFSAVSKSAAPTSQAITSRISTGIIVQSEGIAAGLKTNALSALVGIFVLALF